ncbi:MAG: hypothetical protein EOM91_15025 [Sphingobacteriia bacterium]|nr:hypothetical protein [Sphingobacteriia bacterium]NCC41060.1 hypothetical protein [Gammaproteobacteria bacterium]
MSTTYQLGRRSIENYLPEQTLRRWQSKGQGAEKTRRRKLIDALCELRKSWPEAARQIDMKGGLLGDVSPAVRSKVEKHGRDLRDEDLDNLFQGLPEPVRRQLKKGFGRSIAELFESDLPGFDDSFRMEFDRDAQAHAQGRETIIASLLARL